MVKITQIFFSTLLLVVLPSTVFANFSDSSNDSTYGIAAGSHSNTQWDSGNSWFELNATGVTNGTGTFTSRIFDALSSTSWTSFAWTPSQAYLKELPDSAASESAYSAANADMSNNVLLMHMNESSGTLSDTSGSSITGTVNGNPTYGSAGEFNNSLLFDGTGDYVSLTNSTNLQLTSTPTISAWVKRTGGNSTVRGIFSKMTNVSGTYKGYVLMMGSDNKFQIVAGNNSTITTVSKSNSAYTDSNWHHVVAVKSAGKFILYVDGVAQTESATSPITDSGAAAVIGRSYSNLDSSYFVGNIDEVAVYSRALGATEVLNLYKRGAERVRFQVRSCDDAACSGESFVGPGASASTYFEEQDSNSAALPSVSLSGVVSSNRYFQYQATLETSSSSYSPDVKSVTLSTPSYGVLHTNFTTGNGSTDIASASDLSAISSLKLAKSVGSIQWSGSTDIRQLDLDSNVNIGSGYVSLNIPALHSSLDSQATISLSVDSCSIYTLYYSTGFHSSVNDLVGSGQVCDATSTPACTSISCTNNVVTFTAPHFDGYGVVSSAATPEFSTWALLFTGLSCFYYLSKKTGGYFVKGA